jgi:hypothetical protein
MEHLVNQEQFERLLGQNDDGTTVPEFCIIYFTAKWCRPCQGINKQALMDSTLPSIKWYMCDVDENNYTPGYCGIRGIPAFLAISKKKIVGQLQSSDMQKILDWMRTLPMPNVVG